MRSGPGGDLGLRDAGYYAMDSLRSRRRYRAWGRELTTEDTPWEAGLGFAVRLDKAVPFIGRDALLAQRARRSRSGCCRSCWRIRTALPWGDEPICATARVVGTLTSAAYGHTLGRAVAMGYVRCAPGEAGEGAGRARATRSTSPGRA